MKKLVLFGAILTLILAGGSVAQTEESPIMDGFHAVGQAIEDRFSSLEEQAGGHEAQLADHEARIAALEEGDPPPPPPPDPAACEDTLDNDGDDLIDFPSDPGCESAADDDEFNEPPPPPPPPGENVCLVSNRDTWELAGTDCEFGTLINFTNEQFRCNEPLSTYGELPLKLVWNFTGNPNFGDQGHLMFGSGCVGDSNDDTIDVIVQSNADGHTLGACGGGGKFQQSPGPRNIQITGNFDAGPVCGGAHQDVWQFHPANPDANIDIVNGTSGNWEAGMATVIGAGGAIFFSDVYGIDVYGGRYVTCNHGYFGNSSSFNQVVDAGFRTGRTDGSDPRCSGFSASDPCILRVSSPAQVTNVIAERWLGSQWVSRPCRT